MFHNIKKGSTMFQAVTVVVIEDRINLIYISEYQGIVKCSILLC